MSASSKTAIVPVIASSAVYDAGCRRCTRLATFLDAVHAEHPTYWCKPVPPFGDTSARLLIVGLAPGMHGANATGRPFTGDYAGILLYSTLHRYGYASAGTAVARDDGLRLTDCRINNAVKCLPPQNKPTPDEAKRCNAWLAADIATLPPGSAILALGLIAHDAVLRALELKRGAFRFSHQARHALPNATLFDSYHCSRYNTNTRRLTTDMFHAVFTDIAAYLGRPQPG